MEAAGEVEPRGTAALILGASAWPRAPRLEAAPSFAQSARDVAAYLTDPRGFALPRDNLLDLFDLDAEAIEIQDRIAEFLAGTRARLEADGRKLRDIIIFYVGHGAYDEGPASEFYLAVRRTRAGNELASSLSAGHLARVLRAGGRRARRYVILDCCFAGAVLREFMLQSTLAQAMVQKLRHEFPVEGTALLCSSSSLDPSKAPRGEAHTMFSGALLEVLRGGDPDHDHAFSIEALAEAMTERIRRRFEDAATRPEVHCPDQRTGQVSKVPLFRNPATFGTTRPEATQPEPTRPEITQGEAKPRDTTRALAAARLRILRALRVRAARAPPPPRTPPVSPPPPADAEAVRKLRNRSLAAAALLLVGGMIDRAGTGGPIGLLAALVAIVALLACIYTVAIGSLMLAFASVAGARTDGDTVKLGWLGIAGAVLRRDLRRMVMLLGAAVVVFLALVIN